MVAMDTTLCTEGINLSMLLYLSISDNACFRRSASCGSMTGRVSVVTNSPRSGGTVDTVAQANEEIIVQMYIASEYCNG